MLILDSKTAVSGAHDGILLCLQTVIPSLFSFFILSILLTSSLSGLPMPLLRPLGKLCHIPSGAESLLLTGFLGGYPVGAQNVSAAYQRGQLSRQDAQRMLAFCNNAGPAFLFGMVGAMFPDAKTPWLLWGIHIAGALFTGFLLPGKSEIPFQPSPRQQTISLADALQTALRVMASVCGWVVLFRVITGFLTKWLLWLFPAELQVLLIGLLELSNGCCELNRISDLSLRFLTCSGMLSFGGLCVTMQTITVTQGLSLCYYFLGKGLQTLFSLLLCMGILYGNWLPFAALFLFSGAIHQKYEKRAGIPSRFGI